MLKKIVRYCFIALCLITFLVSLVAFLRRDQVLAKKMNNVYSDNANYVCLSGEIIAINNNRVTIQSKDLETYLSYQTDGICEYTIYSSETLNLTVGETIDFKTVPNHFYNGHKLPIVEVKVNDQILLDFETGKRNLIDWVNTNFQ